MHPSGVAQVSCIFALRARFVSVQLQQNCITFAALAASVSVTAAGSCGRGGTTDPAPTPDSEVRGCCTQLLRLQDHRPHGSRTGIPGIEPRKRAPRRNTRHNGRVRSFAGLKQ